MTTATVDVELADFVEVDGIEDATWAYLNALSIEELRAKLFPYVRNSMRILKRNRCRAIERLVFTGDDGDGTAEERHAVDLLAERRKLVDESFALPDGRRVRWLDATAADHRARAEWQRSKAKGHIDDAERHEVAASVIEEFNVSCLAEIQA